MEMPENNESELVFTKEGMKVRKKVELLHPKGCNVEKVCFNPTS